MQRPKVQPHNLDAERTVLGSVLLDNDSMPVLLAMLDCLEKPLIGTNGRMRQRLRKGVPDEWQAEIFYRSGHAKIWKAMTRLHEEGAPIDLITLAEEMNRQQTLQEAGGTGYLASLPMSVVNPANVRFHFEIVVDCYHRRLAANAFRVAADELCDKTHEGTPATRITRLIDEIRPVFADHREITKVDFSNPADRAAFLRASKQSKHGVLVVKWPWICLNKIVKGCRTRTIVVFTLEYKRGKTSALCQVALSFGEQLCKMDPRNRIIFFSTEDSTDLIAQTFTSQSEVIDRNDWLDLPFPPHAEEAYEHVVNERLPRLGISLVQHGILTPRHIEDAIRDEEQRGNRVRFVFIDYFQKCEPSRHVQGHSRLWDVLMGQLRDLCFRYGIGIIMVQQAGAKKKSGNIDDETRGYQGGRAAEMQCDLPIRIAVAKGRVAPEGMVAYDFLVNDGKGTDCGKFPAWFAKRYALWGEGSDPKEFEAEILCAEQQRLKRLGQHQSTLELPTSDDPDDELPF